MPKRIDDRNRLLLPKEALDILSKDVIITIYENRVEIKKNVNNK